MLAKQMVAPNSPQWFNTGLHWAYGVDGPGQGHYYVDSMTGKLTKSKSAYEHPQPHACFIQGVEDDLVNEGGIMDLWVREARLFKYGSGTGSNFSRLRGEGERLSGGGRSSGLMSFLKIGDRAAGAIKSRRHHAPRRQDGGGRRRSPRYRDLYRLEGEGGAEGRRPRHRLQDQPEAPQGRAEGLRQLRRLAATTASIPRRTRRCAARSSSRAARWCTDTMIKRVIQFAKQGYKEIDFPIYDTDWDSEAYLTVSGQNSNNSVSLKDDFLRAVETDGDWNLIGRTNKKVTKTLKARDLWEKIGHAAWASADPGLHFNTTMNDWHTCKASGDIRASQSVLGIHVPGRHRLQPGLGQPAHLLRHHRQRVRRRRLRASVPAVDRRARNLRDDGAVPVEAIAELSYEFRTLGLGFANIGGLLMTMGLSYDSKEGRALCGALTAIMTGVAYATSAEMAQEARPLPRLQEERRAHAARDPQPPPRRAWRKPRL